MRQLKFKRFLGMGTGLVVLLLLLLGMVEILAVLGEGERGNRFSFRVLFKDVQGLRRGSRVVYRGMDAGTVGEMSPAAGGGRVAVTVHLRKEMRALARTTTQCWVVRPRLGFLSHQLSGLDTLIKESYLRLRAGQGGRPLEEGETLLGLETPPMDIGEEELEDPRPGDLVGRVLFPRNHGLGPGSPVTFRGMPLGRVRRVRLVDRGKAVLVVFHVPRAFRETVRSGSRFWITRPTLRGSILSGISVEDLGSVFSPALAYDSPSSDKSPPAPDGALFTGLSFPPKAGEKWKSRRVDPARIAAEARDLLPSKGSLSPWVKVLYRAVDKDTIGADDPIEGEGEGVFYKGKKGALFVLTGRSASDGRWLMRSHWYDRLRIAKEKITVTLSNGRILEARRVWVAPEKDLAVLQVEASDVGSILKLLPPWKEYLSFEKPGKSGETATKGSSGGTPWGEAVLLKAKGKAWGIRGLARYSRKKTSVAPFSLVPPQFRPGK